MRRPLTLHELLEALARGERQGSFGPCPVCNADHRGSSDRRGPLGITRGGFWTCYRCDAWGSAADLSRRLEGVPKPEGQPLAPRYDTGRGIPDTVAAATWRAVEAEADLHRGHRLDYLARVRGWAPDLAEAGADVSGFGWAPEARIDRAVRRALRGFAVLFAVADETGSTWTLHTRPEAGSPAKGTGPKAKGLPTAGEGRLAVLGHLPSTVQAGADGAWIYLCEGELDRLAVAAVARLDRSGAGVLGARGIDQLPALAAARAAELRRRGIRPRVCLVRQNEGKAEKAGAKAAEAWARAAEALRGVATVYQVLPAAHPNGAKVDAADVAREGADRLRAVLEAADLLHAPGLDVPEARAGLLDRLRALWSLTAVARLIVAVAPLGLGKTHAALALVAELARMGARVVYALPTHKQAAARMADFLRDHPGVQALHVEGLERRCPLMVDLARMEGPDKPRASACLGAALLCRGCPRRSDTGGDCDGWKRPEAVAGAVTFATHAMLPHIGGPDVDIIVDELPEPLQVEPVTRARLASLRRGPVEWRERGAPATVELVDRLGAYLEAEARALARKAAGGEDHEGEHAEYRDLPQVLTALRNAIPPDLPGRVLAETAQPPASYPEAARKGHTMDLPDRGAWIVGRELARLLADPDATVDPEVADRIVARLDPLDPSGSSLDLHRVTLLPAGRLLMLDGTAPERRLELEEWARRNGRALTLDVQTLAPTRGTVATYRRCGQFTASRLWTRQGGRVCFKGDAPGAVRAALHGAIGRAAAKRPGLEDGGRIGVIALKPLADVLRWGDKLAANPEASPPEKAAFSADDWNARAVAEVVANLVRCGWPLTIGHFGADHRGSRIFEPGEAGPLDVYVVLGVPRRNLGSERAIAATMSPDLEVAARIVAGRAEAETVQALGRHRPLDNPDVHAEHHADRARPTASAHALPNLAFVVLEAEAGRPEAVPTLDAEAVQAAAKVAELADRLGGLTLAAVQTASGLGRRAVERLAEAEARRRGWPERRGADNRREWGAMINDSDGLPLIRDQDPLPLAVPSPVLRRDYRETLEIIEYPPDAVQALEAALSGLDLLDRAEAGRPEAGAEAMRRGWARLLDGRLALTVGGQRVRAALRGQVLDLLDARMAPDEWSDAEAPSGVAA